MDEPLQCDKDTPISIKYTFTGETFNTDSVDIIYMERGTQITLWGAKIIKATAVLRRRWVSLCVAGFIQRRDCSPWLHWGFSEGFPTGHYGWGVLQAVCQYWDGPLSAGSGLLCLTQWDCPGWEQNLLNWEVLQKQGTAPQREGGVFSFSPLVHHSLTHCLCFAVNWLVSVWNDSDRQWYWSSKNLITLLILSASPFLTCVLHCRCRCSSRPLKRFLERRAPCSCQLSLALCVASVLWIRAS